MTKRMAAKRVENLRIVHEHDEDARPDAEQEAKEDWAKIQEEFEEMEGDE